FVPGDGDKQDHPCAFEVPLRGQGVKLRDVRARFPLPGTYHFRFRMRWEPGRLACRRRWRTRSPWSPWQTTRSLPRFCGSPGATAGLRAHQPRAHRRGRRPRPARPRRRRRRQRRPPSRHRTCWTSTAPSAPAGRAARRPRLARPATSTASSAESFAPRAFAQLLCHSTIRIMLPSGSICSHDSCPSVLAIACGLSGSHLCCQSPCIAAARPEPFAVSRTDMADHRLG
ncbi:unnamed protein product, partial [Prorocentrum cordatum]